MANTFNFNHYPEKKLPAVERAREIRAEKSFSQKLERLERLEAARDIAEEYMRLSKRGEISTQAGLNDERRNVIMKNQKNTLNRFTDTTRILAKGVEISNDTRKTGVNNNDLIIGPSGAGKTRGYIIPYILHSEESMIVADTKGNLCRLYGKYLKEKGYDVKCIDFKDVQDTACGYNPLDYIRVRDGIVNDQDVMRVAEAMYPSQDKTEPFWDNSAKMFLGAFIAYVMERLEVKDHSLAAVCELYRSSIQVDEKGNIKLCDALLEYCNEYPDSTFARKMGQFNVIGSANRTISSVIMFINSNLAAIDTRSVCDMLSMENRVNFNDFFDHKVALFINVSDNDRTLDGLVNLLYTQALQTFINGADKLPESKMPIPIRFLLDDFSTNTKIPDFNNIISVIRSRDISVSLIIQSFSQLDCLYGETAAQTIADNCEHWLYLGTLNFNTANEIAQRLNIQVTSVLNMPINEAYIIARGGKPEKVEKYDLEEDAVYKHLKFIAARQQSASAKEMPEIPAV